MADPTTEPLATLTETEELPRTKEKLEELSQAASIHYSTKNFAAAAEHYANAVEIQAELNGEMAPENAELLFYYGRALYKVAVAKSDVLGNKVAQEEKKNKKPKAKKAKAEAGEGFSAAKAEPKEEDVNSKPYFQLTGDENWTDSEDEDEDADVEDGEQEDDDDDFGNAYEVFELARVLYQRQLDAPDGGDVSDKGKGKGASELTPRERIIKERIADCHGFLVDISLENERFHDAISDARKALALQEEIRPFEHENVTEAHYSLSLALEFASVSKVREDQTGQSTDAPAEKKENEDEDGVNWHLRKEAAEQTDLAIQSLEARLKVEEAALSSGSLKPEQKKEKQVIIEDKKGMLEDLKTRLTDLKSDPTKQDFDSIDPSVFQGLLGGLLGADVATQKAKIAEATKGANDVSGMVKKKAKAPVASRSGSKDAGSSKRKLEVDDGGADGKRAKTEEPA
jgi:HAT1-interacting factor 1